MAAIFLLYKLRSVPNVFTCIRPRSKRDGRVNSPYKACPRVLVIFHAGLGTKIITRPSGDSNSLESDSCYENAGATITGTVMSVTCDPNTIAKVKEEDVHSHNCTEVFRWHIPDGWCSPVPLLYNVTVPMIRKPKARRIVKVELNLTVEGWQEAKVRWDEDSLEEGYLRYVTKTCNYTATIVFSVSKNYPEKNEELKKLQEICNREEPSASAASRITCLIQGEYLQNVCRLPREDISE
ncbi:uncharacterized protein LOC142591018 isoform X2 [Dermacentor variabilis]|uniref:uncharacterized protein LOC142591018 isoform X2 n=1 Tax=Dermacentor variabilis TaxID=34621 RepID=UPI003F5CAD92